MSEKIGVVLLNLGGPDSLEAVEPFLFNLFSDPDIIDFPGSFLFRKRLAKLISTRRSPGVIKQYEEIGGKSPLKEYTLQQANLLEQKLNESLAPKVYVAMRYWRPFTDEAIDAIERDECAASMGQTRFFNQSMSARSSAAPRKIVWQRWM